MKNKFLTFAVIGLLALGALTVLFSFVGETRAAVNADLPSINSSPTINAVQPNTAPNDMETPIVIQGGGFSATISGTEVTSAPLVYLGDVELPEVIWGNTTTLSAVVPWKLPAQVYSLTVVNSDGFSATLTSAFTVTDHLPTVDAVEPDTTTNDLMTELVIHGSNFKAVITGTLVLTVPQVYLGNVELPNVIWGNTTTLSATVPWKLPAQVYPLTVVNPNGISTTLPNALTMIENLPKLDSMEPQTGPNDVDTQIVIHGEKIGAVISGTEVLTPPTVFLGDEQLPPITWVDATTLEGAVPWGLPADVYTLTVFNPNGISATLQSAFTVTDALNEFHTGGPYGGMSMELRLKPGDSGTVYALMYGAGLFISEDGAATWQPIHDHDWPLQLDFDAADPNTLYFGADSNDLYRSDDNGANWVRISEDLHTQNGCFRSYPVAHPTQTGWVYFGMGACGDIYLEPDEGGVYFSINRGETWSLKNNGLTDRDIQALTINPNAPDTLMAGTADGNLFYSTNGGDNWVWSTQLTGTVSRLYFNPYETLEAWAITRSEADGNTYLYHSVNLTDWTPINLSLSSFGGPTLAQMDFLPDSVWLAAIDVYKSMDSGSTWTTGNNSPMWGATSLAVSPDNPQTIYAGTDFGVEKSIDGGNTWAEMIEGLAALVPNAMAVSSIHPDTVYVKMHQGIYASKNGGYDWQYLDYGVGGFNGNHSLAIDPFDDTKLYLNAYCEDEFCIEISPDEGTTWNWVTSALPPAYAGWTCSSFTILPSPHTQGRVLVGASLTPPGGGDVESIFFTSNNGGTTWSSILPPQTLGRVTEMVYDAINSNLIYAATVGTGLWRSTNGGSSWSLVPVAGKSDISVSAIAVHPNLTNLIYIRSSAIDVPNPEPELWFSKDAGANWQSMSYVFLGVDLMMAPPIPDQFLYTLYTGCQLGLCRSFNDGAGWDPIAGMPRPEILNATSDGERSVIYLGTPGGLVYGVGIQAALDADDVPGLGNLGGGGVYRLVTVLPDHWIYLPLIIR